MTTPNNKTKVSIMRRLVTGLVLVLATIFALLAILVVASSIEQSKQEGRDRLLSGNDGTTISQQNIKNRQASQARNSITEVDFSGHLKVDESQAIQLKPIPTSFSHKDSLIPNVNKLEGGNGGSVNSGSIVDIKLIDTPRPAIGQAFIRGQVTPPVILSLTSKLK